MGYELRCCGHAAEKHRRDFDRSIVWCEVCDNQEQGGCYEAPGEAREEEEAEPPVEA